MIDSTPEVFETGTCPPIEEVKARYPEPKVLDLDLAKRQSEAFQKFDRYEINPPRDWPGWEPSEDRLLTGDPKLFSNGLRWEMDHYGAHRIVEVKDDKRIGGDWARYESIAVSPDGAYIAVTAYFEGSLPIETLLKIEVVPRNTT